VKAGQVLSFIFENKDNVTHNFAVYDTQAGEHVIFRGDALSGPGTITYTFIVPDAPGIYYFQCDFHPSTMNGSFIVEGFAS
jgi:plastocyanin